MLRGLVVSNWAAHMGIPWLASFWFAPLVHHMCGKGLYVRGGISFGLVGASSYSSTDMDIAMMEKSVQYLKLIDLMILCMLHTLLVIINSDDDDDGNNNSNYQVQKCLKYLASLTPRFHFCLQKLTIRYSG